MDKIKRIVVYLLTLNFLLPIQVFASHIDMGKVNEELKNFGGEISWIASAFVSLSLATSLLIFIINFIRLACSYTHPLIRQKVLKDILISGICTALLGGGNLIFWVMFYTVW